MQQGLDIDGEAADDNSGRSVSINAAGDIVAIGAPYNDGNGTDSGHVRVYTNNLGYIADSYKLSNLNPSASGLLTVTGNISAAEVIYSNNGNSNLWNSVYTLFSSNSASYLKTSTASVIIAQPGDNLIAKYAEAVALTPNGSAKSATNRASLIILPGNYSISSELAINTEFVDLIGLGEQTKKSAVLVSNNTLNVIANDVRVSGISVGAQTFKIADTKQLQVFENCTGGDDSFGGVSGMASGTFVNCVGGDDSFGGFGGRASGTFVNCVGGTGSFGGGDGGITSNGSKFINCVGGNGSFGSEEADGTFTGCTGGENSFAAGGTAYGTFNNCTAGGTSFGSGGTLTGKLFYCRLTTGTYTTPTGSGIIRLSIDGNNDVINAQAI